jgi:hypothetical protein
LIRLHLSSFKISIKVNGLKKLFTVKKKKHSTINNYNMERLKERKLF